MRHSRPPWHGGRVGFGNPSHPATRSARRPQASALFSSRHPRYIRYIRFARGNPLHPWTSVTPVTPVALVAGERALLEEHEAPRRPARRGRGRRPEPQRHVDVLIDVLSSAPPHLARAARPSISGVPSKAFPSPATRLRCPSASGTGLGLASQPKEVAASALMDPELPLQSSHPSRPPHHRSLAARGHCRLYCPPFPLREQPGSGHLPCGSRRSPHRGN